jgi:rhodanese-related sulfurtransferase
MLACAGLMAICLGSGCGTESVMGEASGNPTSNVLHVDAHQAARLLADQEMVILDIRTPREYTAGHLAGATNLDFYARDFSEQLARLDRSQTYLLHCASGGRSQDALPEFERLGFESVLHLDGGVKSWKSAGYPVEK